MQWQLEIGKEEVMRHLKSIKQYKSSEADGIYPRLREEIVGALTKIFASSLASDVVLEGWRVANGATIQAIIGRRACAIDWKAIGEVFSAYKLLPFGRVS